MSPTSTEDGAPSPSSSGSSGPEYRGDGQVKGEDASGPLVGSTDAIDQEEENLSGLGDGVLGGESESTGSPAADLEPSTLRTHTDLGDLELAAEKALDLLRDEGADLPGGNGGLGGGSGGGDAGSGGSSAAEGRGSGDVAEASGSGVPTEQAGGGGARVSARSKGAPPQGGDSGVAVRLRAHSSTGRSNPAALPVRGLRAPGRSARRRASGKQQRQQQQQQQQEGEAEQVERQATAESPETVTEGKEKVEAKTKSSKVTAGGVSLSPTNPEVSRVPPPPEDAAAPLPSGEGDGGSGSASRRRHSTSFVAVAARAVSPAVCRIDMERLVGTHGAPFGDVETGQGSGLIFSSDDGLVLTNAHVVAGARKVCMVALGTAAGQPG